jgi:hypothetical protein
MFKYTLPLITCHQLGKSMAVAGWNEDQIRDWLRSGNISDRGLTARRILKSYRRQLEAR